jgi:RNA polymerase sigma-70 factor, ECF subfamily
MKDESDAELVAAVRNGSRASAGQLAERYLRHCRAVALAFVSEPADAEDIAQDSFIYAMRRIDDCRQPDRFSGWLFQIVRNRARNFVRDGRRRDVLGRTAAPNAAVSPLADAERAQLRSRLLSALSHLSPERREVVLLHDLEGWTHVAIAERMDLPPGTVRSHLHHARRKLRKLLEEEREGLHEG